MTREEEIEKVLDDNFDTDLYDYKTDDSYCNYCAGFRQGVEWADKHPNSPWVDAKNELPTKGGHYLCMDDNHFVTTLAFNGDEWFNSRTFFDVSLESVKYWMTIPKLPKEK